MTEPPAMIHLDPADTLLGLKAATKPALLRHLAHHAAARTGHDAATLFALLQAREALGSTGIGRGVAVPHARTPGIAAPFCCFCRLDRPIPFDAIDSAPVDLALLLLTPADADAGHLALLSAAARRLREPATAAELRHATDPATILRLLSR